MCPLWVKLYNVPLVAFNKEGISRIASAIGIPIRMDACTSSTCDKLWGRTSFAKVLINVWAKGELKTEVEVVIPRISGNGEDVVKVVVEYDWEPSQCSICKNFGHVDSVCVKGVVRREKDQPKMMDRDGFQRPRRQQWRRKAIKEIPRVHQAETSKTSNEPLTKDILVGVGSLKQVDAVPKQKDDDGVLVGGKPVTQSDGGEFCTVHAGRTPGGKEGNVTVEQRKDKGPTLVQSVVQTFKQQLQPRRGVVISEANANRFSPLSSEESSDDDDMTIIDTSTLAKGGVSDVGTQSGRSDAMQPGIPPTPLSQ